MVFRILFNVHFALIPSKLTDEVVSRYKDCPDPRLKEIMISLIKHLHSFAREVKLTEAEWFKGIEFLTRSASSAMKRARNSFSCPTCWVWR